MSDETAKMYETMTDDDLAHFWNKGKMIDDDGTLEEELMFRGFKDLYRSNGRRNRRLDAGVSPRARCAIMRASSSSASSRVLQDFHCCVPFTRADTTHALPRRRMLVCFAISRPLLARSAHQRAPRSSPRDVLTVA